MAETPETPTSPLGTFLSKNKDKILIGLVLYLLGVNQGQSDIIKREQRAKERAESKYDNYRDAQIIAANRIAFHEMLRSDSTFIIGRDSVLHLPLPDTTQKE